MNPVRTAKEIEVTDIEICDLFIELQDWETSEGATLKIYSKEIKNNLCALELSIAELDALQKVINKHIGE